MEKINVTGSCDKTYRVLKKQIKMLKSQKNKLSKQQRLNPKIIVNILFRLSN